MKGWIVLFRLSVHLTDLLLYFENMCFYCTTFGTYLKHSSVRFCPFAVGWWTIQSTFHEDQDKKNTENPELLHDPCWQLLWGVCAEMLCFTFLKRGAVCYSQTSALSSHLFKGCCSRSIVQIQLYKHMLCCQVLLKETRVSPETPLNKPNFFIHFLILLSSN